MESGGKRKWRDGWTRPSGHIPGWPHGPYSYFPGAQTWVSGVKLQAFWRRCGAIGEATIGVKLPEGQSVRAPHGPRTQSTEMSLLAHTAAAAGDPAPAAPVSAASARRDVMLPSQRLAICTVGGRPGGYALGLSHSPDGKQKKKPHRQPQDPRTPARAASR